MKRMADIEIVYISGHGCDFGQRGSTEEPRCNICHQFARTASGACKYFHACDDNDDCIHAHDEVTRLGWSGKKYIIYPPYIDITDHSFDRMTVELGEKRYCDCIRVVLNGKCIFNRFSMIRREEEAE